MIVPMFLGIFGMGGWEMVLILAVVLLLFGARQLPDLRQGLREGLSEFRKQSDQAAQEAGESLGGIYGKPAAEALTPNNQTAELYDPSAFHREARGGRVNRWKVFQRWRQFWGSVWHLMLKRLKARGESQQSPDGYSSQEDNRPRDS